VFVYCKVTYSGLDTTTDSSPATFNLPFTPSQNGGCFAMHDSSNSGLSIGDRENVYFRVVTAAANVNLRGLNDSNEFDYNSGNVNSSGTLEIAGTYTA